MDEEHRIDLTALINEARAGSKDAKDRLLRAVYGEFHRIADGLMRNERPGHTLQPTALVNEAVVRLLDGQTFEKAPNRRYLLAAAAQAMRRILVDHARKRNARNGQLKRVPLDEVLAYFEEKRLDFIALDEALDRLSSLHERQALVVVLRFFAGLPAAEVADVLGVSLGTVEGDWRFARAWLRGQIGEVER
ncbi:MAG TPA: ECF-type sigma factor [Isosphaeraceae bacterium]|nr:ECF-type sigma factor [Isosphaeraceae bacterium]